ncbi:MAG TPA: SET domain-containing protein-lysine N-methyltransferase [Rhizomicrobium sp.]|nr:SET domain-containing protein-lysine N-methyltransferase [Rhizomicrobium sp.]
MDKIEYVKIPGRGRGVVARRALSAGEALETSPVLPLALKDSECPGLDSYSLAWGEDVEGGLGEQKACAIGLGYLSLYNHSKTPNVTFDHHYDVDEITVLTLRDIAQGEELTIDYGVPLWFEEKTQ